MDKSLLAVVASVSLLGMSAPAFADAFDVAEGLANTHLGTKYSVPDFDLKRPEFGGPVAVKVIHLVKDVAFDTVFGGEVDYVPAKADVQLYVNAGSAFKPRIADGTCANLAGKVSPGVPSSTPSRKAPGFNICETADTLVGNAGGVVPGELLLGNDRSCTWTAKFRDTHTC